MSIADFALFGIIGAITGITLIAFVIIMVSLAASCVKQLWSEPLPWWVRTAGLCM